MCDPWPLLIYAEVVAPVYLADLPAVPPPDAIFRIYTDSRSNAAAALSSIVHNATAAECSRGVQANIDVMDVLLSFSVQPDERRSILQLC